MLAYLIIPKRYDTVSKCIETLLASPSQSAFQSEIKKIVYSRSWRTVVKREFILLNQIINDVMPGSNIISMINMKNPHTGKRNEVLLQINPRVVIENHKQYFLARINRGETHENRKP